ncbi:hypothetical protein L6164_027441 [Bauhinia variegata]|uniref:Uncharacterized protein n=1 Tax=Bauhinia variegata TaxID=167791 RepID=A0ACB9LTD1_BAUVA|nr:hypothetical protein L6164_027441 [Bauhinia variegata]
MLQLVLRRRGVVFWTSGQLKNQSFENMIEADTNFVENYNMIHERNSGEEFFSYSLKEDHPTSGNHQEVKWRIGFRSTIWFEDVGLPLENICYGYNTDRGCAEWTQPECRSDKPIFVSRSGFFRGLTPNDSNNQIFNNDKSLGPGDCRAICWNDCDCLGYLKNSSNGCIMWRGQLQFEPDSSQAAPTIFVISNQTDTADSSNQGRRARSKKWIWVAAAVPSSIVACVAVIIFLVCRKQKGDKEKNYLARMTRSDRLGDATEFENDGNIDGNLKVFCFESISEATNNFSEDNKLGEGGFGPVFKGTFLGGQNELIARTSKVVGTYGYMSPEYGMQGIFSTKSDIFSFGVLLLEIVSGKRNNSFHDNNGPLNLVGYAWDLWQSGDEAELMDPTLRDSCNTKQLVRYIHVGLLCVEDSPADRPTISEVITMITNERTLLPMLKKPAFLNLSTAINGGSKGNELEYQSVNGFSTSIVYAR